MVIKPLANEVKQTTHKRTSVSRTGLNQQEVEERREQYGANEFSKPKEQSLLSEILEVFKEPLMVVLIIAGGMSLLVGEYQDGVGIFMAVLLGIIIGRLTEGKSRKAAESLAKMTDNVLVKVMRDGKKQQIQKSEVVPGDLVFLEAGDMVPADGVMLEAYELKMREDMLTGESKQVSKMANSPVFGGTLVGDGNGLMSVVKIGDETEMGTIAKELDQEEEMTPLQQKLGKLGQKISSFSSMIAIMLFIYMVIQIARESQLSLEFSSLDSFLTSIQGWYIAFPSLKTAFVVCVGLIVAAVPEGLPTMINITLALTMNRMAKVNVLIRKKEACETIGSVSVICSDKTGTLTENKMKVKKIFLGGDEVLATNLQMYPTFIENCIINSTADFEVKDNQEIYIGNPTEGALISVIGNSNYRDLRDTAHVVRKVPFSSENKYMMTMLEKGQRYLVLSKGAPEVILMQCGYESVQDELKPLTSSRVEEILKKIEAWQSEGMRVLAFAAKETTSKSEVTKINDWRGKLVFQGFVGISDPLREGVKEAIECAREAQIETKILTGDNIHTATAIGKEIGIVTPNMRVVEASYIEGLTDSQLQEEIKTISIVARSMPNTKMRIVDALQKSGEVVAVTGDGINDAPALTKADVGIAMGIAGTEVSRNAADIILTDDNFNTIVEAIKWGRGIYNNFQRYIQFTLTVNIIAFLIMIISQILDFPLPFTTIHLLWVNIIMDGPPALALGLEPVRSSVMNRKPISREANIINKYMVVTILLNSAFIATLLFLQMRFNFLGADLTNITVHGNEAQTVMFSLFACLAIFNALNCREFGLVSIVSNFFKNKIALGILFLTLVIQISATQFVSGFFDAVPLTVAMWVRILALASTVVLFNEFIKFVVRQINVSRKRKLETNQKDEIKIHLEKTEKKNAVNVNKKSKV